MTVIITLVQFIAAMLPWNQPTFLQDETKDLKDDFAVRSGKVQDAIRFPFSFPVVPPSVRRRNRSLWMGFQKTGFCIALGELCLC